MIQLVESKLLNYVCIEILNLTRKMKTRIQTYLPCHIYSVGSEFIIYFSGTNSTASATTNPRASLFEI